MAKALPKQAVKAVLKGWADANDMVTAKKPKQAARKPAPKKK